jgi:hypothetical protein
MPRSSPPNAQALADATENATTSKLPPSRDSGFVLWTNPDVTKSNTDFAEQAGVTHADVCRLLPLTCLAPGIVGGHTRRAIAQRAEASRDAEGRAAGLE